MYTLLPRQQVHVLALLMTIWYIVVASFPGRVGGEKDVFPPPTRPGNEANIVVAPCERRPRPWTPTRPELITHSIFSIIGVLHCKEFVDGTHVFGLQCR